MQSSFVWFDLMTTNVPTAKAFYAKLFGWKGVVIETSATGTYEILSNQGTQFGGLVALGEGQGARSCWMPYLSHDNLDALGERVTAAGGKVRIPPMDIPFVGRFATLEDPQGAQLSALSMLPDVPYHPAEPELGLVCWNELVTPDPEGAAAFYTGVFGWNATPGVPSPNYWVFNHDKPSASGMIPAPAESERPHWLPYFQVEHLDVSFARGRDLGAAVLMPPTDIPQMGRYAILADPTGAHLALYESR